MHPSILPLCIYTAEDVMPVVSMDELAENKLLRAVIQRLAAQKYALILLEKVCPILEAGGSCHVSLIYYDGPHPVIDSCILKDQAEKVISLTPSLQDHLNEIVGPYLVYAENEVDELDTYVCNIFFNNQPYEPKSLTSTEDFKQLIEEAYEFAFGKGAFDEWISLKGKKTLESVLPVAPSKTNSLRL